MFFKLFIAFAVLPVLEIYVLIQVGTRIGAANTVILVLLSALIGAWLARLEGMRTLLKIRENMSRGIMPAEELLDALLIFIAGAVLLTPGFITDVLGLLVLLPPTRNRFKRWLRKKFDEWIDQGRMQVRRRF
jgi:UPF0716 protein FxsA